MRIRAFQGLVPGEGFYEKVPSVPYDVVNREEAAALAEGKPFSFLRIVRADLEMPEEVGTYDDGTYTQAVANLKKFQDEGALVREPGRCLYLYRQVMGEHVQTGLVAVCHVEDYENDIIKKHEKTRPVKENDRTRLTSDLGANTGPVFLTYKDEAAVDAIVEKTTSEESPACDVVAPDGVRHVVWKVADPESLVEAFGAVDVSYVADGHHRSASAHRVGNERREANPGHTGEEDYNWFLCVLFPGSQLKILGYNRVVKDLNGLDEAGLLAAVGERFEVSEAADKEPAEGGEVRMYLGGKWYSLAWDAVGGGNPVEALDVSVLQGRLLEPLLGIDDPRTNDRVDFVGGIRGPEELERLVDSGKAAVAFSLYPVSVGELMAISDAGAIMPPKSTWFEPKLRSGFFVHTF